MSTLGTTTAASAEYQPSQRARWAGGQPISQLMAYALQNPDLISLAVGFVDTDTLPASAASDAWSALFQDPQAASAALAVRDDAGPSAVARAAAGADAAG